MRLFLYQILSFTFLLLISNVYAEGVVRVASASNFLLPVKNLQLQYEASSGNKLIISSGSTAKLYAQIMNGAPYDVFLSADQLTVQKLIENKLGVEESEFVYAAGKLVLWGAEHSGDPLILKNDLENLKFSYLAIANPKLAPYGRAALEVLQNLELYGKLSSRLVYGENVGQTFQFVYSGNAELGLVALSQVLQFKNRGQYWQIPLHLYQPLKQSAVQLIRAKTNLAAKSFMHFLKSAKIQHEIASQYGYRSVSPSINLER